MCYLIFTPQVDEMGKRKVLATTPINMVRYASSLPYEHDLHLRLKPVSKKIKSVILEVSLTSEFLKEGKATYVTSREGGVLEGGGGVGCKGGSRPC